MFLEVDTEAIESDSSGNQSENDKINQIQHIQRLSVNRESMTQKQVKGASPPAQPQNGYLSVQRNGQAAAAGHPKQIGKSPDITEHQVGSNGGHEGGASDVSVSHFQQTI